MMEKMTIDEYMNNPAGKGSTVIMGREMILEDLERRYQEMIGDKKNKPLLNHTLLRGRENYYFHITIPSESERENTYDVVICFEPPADNSDVKNDRGLDRYHLRFFSNIPSFTYTYANTYMQHDIHIHELSTKFDDEVIERPPVVRNPSDTVSFEKSLFFALFYIKDILRVVFYDKDRFNKNSVKWTTSYIARRIRNTDEISLEIDKENVRLRNAKKKSRPRRSSIVRSNPKNTKGMSTVGIQGARKVTRPRAKLSGSRRGVRKISGRPKRKGRR